MRTKLAIALTCCLVACSAEAPPPIPPAKILPPQIFRIVGPTDSSKIPLAEANKVDCSIELLGPAEVPPPDAVVLNLTLVLHVAGKNETSLGSWAAKRDRSQNFDPSGAAKYKASISLPQKKGTYYLHARAIFGISEADKFDSQSIKLEVQ